jgi:hypothetical protein
MGQVKVSTLVGFRLLAEVSCFPVDRPFAGAIGALGTFMRVEETEYPCGP